MASRKLDVTSTKHTLRPASVFTVSFNNILGLENFTFTYNLLLLMAL